MTRRCEHGTALGACQEPDCDDRAVHHCLTFPCRTVGCEHSRPTPDIAMLTAAQADTDARTVNPADFPPSAVSKWQEIQHLAERDNASGDITRGRGFIGQNEDGRVTPGGDPWHWSPRGKVAIPCKGAVYAGSNEAAHLVRGITEAEAARRSLAIELARVGAAGLTEMSRAQVNRRAAGRSK